MNELNERIKKVRKVLDLTQQEFADKLSVKRNTVATYERGKSVPSDAAVILICKTFNVSETWLRTGEGEMFVSTPDGALDALAREYELSPGMYILIKRLLALKPENQQAAVDFAVKLAEDLNKNAPAPERPGTDTGGLERTKPDIMSELAELKRQNEEIQRQNQELAAKVAAMEEEDIARGLWDGSSVSPSASAGSFDPARSAKK